MTTGFRLLPAGIEEAQFKRIDEGWLFKSVNPWIFGPQRTYLVNDAQKPAIAQRVRRARYIRLMLLVPIIPLMVMVLIKFPALLSSPSMATALVLGGFVVVCTYAIAIADHLTIRSLLHDLPRSSQKIGIVEMMRNQGTAMSAKALAIFTLIFLIAAAANIYQSMTTARGAALPAMSAAIMLLLGIAFAAMLVAKLRAPRPQP